jgi:RNA polymerase sigma-70 factor (ECF subfamily)
MDDDRSARRAPDGLADAPANTSLQLLARAQAGDPLALDDLLARYLPGLRRWASGRLPNWARDLADTDDVVQDALARAFKRIGQFEARREGALRAYLRQAVFNRIRDEFRRSGRRPPPLELGSDVAADDTSPLDQAIGGETAARYEEALQRLRPEDREAIIVRVELGSTYQEAATALEKPTADAARVAIGRALVKLAREMGRAR